MIHEEEDALVLGDRCAREPVHIIGQIQSHGWLIALSEPELIVRHASANVTALFALPLDVIVGSSLRAILGSRQFEAFRSYAMADDLSTANPLRMIFGDPALDVICVAHRYAGALIAEFELRTDVQTIEPLKFATHIHAPLSRMEQAANILDLLRVAAAEIRRLSGFDRVMIYQFDERWNGEVIVELAGPGALSYLGLRFPASDIPAQARRLFLLNPLRSIADVASKPVPIISEIEPSIGGELDLTRSFLRSSSPIHLEYLQNMGVQATLTISVIVQQRLWGIIACHHLRPRPVDYLTRSICDLVGRFLASHVALRAENAALQSRLAARNELETYMAHVEASTSLFHTQPFEPTRLLELLDADGLVAHIDGVVSYAGTTIDEESLSSVVGKLRRFAARGIASSNMLGTLDDRAHTYATRASGALYLGLAEGSDEYLLLLRRELIETVTWAGNPEKAVNADADGTLRPRTSFAAWKETVRGRTRPWTELQLESARFLREQLLRLRVTGPGQRLGPLTQGEHR